MKGAGHGRKNGQVGSCERGGFVGNETSADAADPKAHPTVLSGDNGRSVYGWTVNGTMPKKGDENYAPIWTDDGEFNVARADDVVAKYRLPCLSTDVGLTQVIKSSTVFPDGTLKEFPLMTKRMVAKRILEEIENEE